MSRTTPTQGFDYGSLDEFKVQCQKRAALTANNARRLGFLPVDWSRGESAFLMHQFVSSMLHRSYGLVIEGLGTKNIVADAMQEVTGKCFYHSIAQDTLAMIVNDSATLGNLPFVAAMHMATGSNDWFKNRARAEALVAGWGDACDLAGCVWGPGETPGLRDIIYPQTAELSGCAVGISHETKQPNPGAIAGGAAIFLIESTGIHANGLTDSREIASKLPKGYLTELPSGRTYGEALLDPTHIYCRFVEACLDANVIIYYGVNITGHGWRKLMRAEQPFAYVIDKLPPQLEIFDFLMEHGAFSKKTAYEKFNMGAGFALYVRNSDSGKLMKVAEQFEDRFHVFHAGHVEKSKKKKVVIRPLNLEFGGETLAIR